VLLPLTNVTDSRSIPNWLENCMALIKNELQLSARCSLPFLDEGLG